jgi:putative chitinase
MIPTLEMLAAAKIKDPAKWLDAVVATCEEYEINTPQRIAGFLAQTSHESGGYTMLKEDLRYRAETLAVCWPNRFAVLGPDKKPVKDAKGKNTPTKVAQAIAGKPELIANMVYSNRMGNGTAESGDGWKYRGRGLKQLTGKDNYTRCGAALGLDLVNNPDYLLDPEGASLSAAWFWNINKCGALADADDFVGLTKKINGGTIGLPDREKRYKAVLASLV